MSLWNLLTSVPVPRMFFPRCVGHVCGKMRATPFFPFILHCLYWRHFYLAFSLDSAFLHHNMSNHFWKGSFWNIKINSCFHFLDFPKFLSEVRVLIFQNGILSLREVSMLKASAKMWVARHLTEQRTALVQKPKTKSSEKRQRIQRGRGTLKNVTEKACNE